MKNRRAFTVQREWLYGQYDDMKSFDTWDEAYEWMCSTHDASNGDDDYRIVETGTGCRWPFPAHKLMFDRCPVCGGQVRRLDLQQTYDCHGIPFRWVCPKCYERIMVLGRNGYDGEYYTEADENIDPDY